MPNRTISVPDDVVPIIESLGVPLPTWVADRLRLHAATRSGESFARQLMIDAELADAPRPTAEESNKALDRMERAAPY